MLMGEGAHKVGADPQPLPLYVGRKGGERSDALRVRRVGEVVADGDIAAEVAPKDILCQCHGEPVGGAPSQGG